MAACSFGSSSIKIPNLNLGSDRTRFKSQPLHWTAIRTPIRYDGFVLSQRSHKPLIGCRCLSAQTQSTTNLEDDSEEAKSSPGISQVIPNSYEVEYLLSEICDTTSIAEFELKLGEFQLHVTRDLTEKTKSSPPPVSAPVINTTAETPSLNVSASSPSLAISKVVPSSGGVPTLLDYAADEGLVILHSPMVGFFRRSRTIKGKRAPPSCKEKQTVKEGQVLCYIEQLGGELPVEADISGEVIKILREDGDPVGYGEALIAILPSFPGIKKLQ